MWPNINAPPSIGRAWTVTVPVSDRLMMLGEWWWGVGDMVKPVSVERDSAPDKLCLRHTCVKSETGQLVVRAPPPPAVFLQRLLRGLPSVLPSGTLLLGKLEFQMTCS